MNEDLKAYEKSIKKKHSFAWTPHYEETTRTELKKSVFSAIVVKTFEKLDWQVVFEDETTVEAKRKDKWNKLTEKITVTLDQKDVIVKSLALQGEFWDLGRNSVRVKLFIHAFQQTEKEFDQEALASLANEIERANNLDDYEIPKSLPQAKERKVPEFWIPFVGGVVVALILGFITALLSLKVIYIIGVFEVAIGFALAFSLTKLIEKSNFTHFDKLRSLLIFMIIVTYVSNQYFQFLIILNENNLEPFSFLEFMEYRFEAGLTIKELNTGWIGLLISWVLQLVITYYIGISSLASSLLSYCIERIPTEVIDFTIYHFVKEKSEDQVRKELSKMGWSNKDDQDEVFEAITAIQSAKELNRME